MDIEKAKSNLLEMLDELKLEQQQNIKVHKYNPETEIQAIQTVLNELDKDNNIISDLQNEVTLKQCELDKKDKIIDLLLNEVAKEGTPSEFEYRKKRILEICKEKAEGK